jgi:hypothetical protein
MLQVEFDQNLAKLKITYILIIFDLQCPVVEIDLQTTNFLHFWNQRVYVCVCVVLGSNYTKDYLLFVLQTTILVI